MWSFAARIRSSPSGLGGTEVKATVDAEFSAKPGSDIGLDVRLTRCYFFDPDTGVRV